MEQIKDTRTNSYNKIIPLNTVSVLEENSNVRELHDTDSNMRRFYIRRKNGHEVL